MDRDGLEDTCRYLAGSFKLVLLPFLFRVLANWFMLLLQRFMVKHSLLELLGLAFGKVFNFACILVLHEDLGILNPVSGLLGLFNC